MASGRGKKKRVWDDDQDIVNERLVATTTPEWAQMPQKKQRQEVEEEISPSLDVFSTSAPMLMRGSGARLMPGILQYSLMGRPQVGGDKEKYMRHLEFHPTSQHHLLAVGTQKPIVQFFQLKGDDNKHMHHQQTVHYGDASFKPVRMLFAPDGAKLYAFGGSSCGVVVDMPTFSVQTVKAVVRKNLTTLTSFAMSPDGKHLVGLGRAGASLHIIDTYWWKLMASLDTPEQHNDVVFDPENPTIMYTCSKGKVYTWDLRALRPMSSMRDEGSIHCTKIALSRHHLAVGSDMGIVNVYDKPPSGTFLESNPKPLKALTSLTTSIDDLKFNSDGQLLGFLSRRLASAFRLAHIPSLLVYSNFPQKLQQESPMPRFTFSSDSWLLAVGCPSGFTVSKLAHYTPTQTLTT